MQIILKKIAFVLFTTAWLSIAVSAQEFNRDLALKSGAELTIVNNFGRVTVLAVPADEGREPESKLSATSNTGVTEKDLKISLNGPPKITVEPSDRQKRIDIKLTVPERTRLNIETTAGAVEISGDLSVVNVKTDTATIATDVPADGLKYTFSWTESKPRYLADFALSSVKEKSAGRYEIKGEQEGDPPAKPGKSKNNELVTNGDDPALGPKNKEKKSKKKQAAGTVLNFTTARGIVLLNVPPNEVLSDLRERPLTEAAKAIIRSGDALLMDAIRRASPKYFGDYARTLPPIKREPAFSEKTVKPVDPRAEIKTAMVRVTDINNRAIDNLTKKDFEITEDNVSREVVAVERSTAPFNLVLLLDVSGSIENYVNFIRKTARNFVDTVDAKDRISIIIFNEDVKVLSKFTTDKGKLSESLDTFDAGGGTAYYDALAYTVSDTLRPMRGERTAIVILTDGDDNRSFLAFDSLLGSIQESGSLIYPLYVPSALIALAAQNMNADIDPLRKKYMSLSAKSEGEGEKLARVSGGVYYPITQIGQIQKAYEDIVSQLRTAYAVTFKSDPNLVSGEGVSPKLKVKVKRENSFTTLYSIVAETKNK